MGIASDLQKAGLDVRMKFFTIRFGRHWHKFVSVDSSSMKVPKTRIDEALSSLV